MSSAQIIDGDLQANQAAYNYSAWYQVSLHHLFFAVGVLYCVFSFMIECWYLISTYYLILYVDHNCHSSIVTCLLLPFQYNYQTPWNYGQYYPPPPT